VGSGRSARRGRRQPGRSSPAPAVGRSSRHTQRARLANARPCHAGHEPALQTRRSSRFEAILERPWAVDGLLGVRPTVVASLSGDHRATDGVTGARYLKILERLLQRPEEL
jgi:hypothetical protein